MSETNPNLDWRCLCQRCDLAMGMLISQLYFTFFDKIAQAFYINLPLGAIAAPGILLLMSSINLQANVPLRQRVLKQTDWVGILLWAGTVTCLTMAIVLGGNSIPWQSGREIALWIVGVVLGALFAFSQYRPIFVEPTYRMYPVQYLKRPILLMLQTLIFLAALCVFVSSITPLTFHD